MLSERPQQEASHRAKDLKKTVTYTSPEPSHSPFRSANIIKNVSSTWMSLLLNALLSVIVAPIVVNKLGNVYYGIWVLLNQFTGYLWLFDFGVRESVIKYVAQYKELDDKKSLVSIVQTSFAIYLLIGAAVVAVCGLMAFALPYFFNIPQDAQNAARVTMFITGMNIAQGFLSNVFIGVLMGVQRFYLVARTGILFSFARALLIVSLLYAGFGIIALSLVQLSVGIGSSLLIYWFTRREVPYLRLSLNLPKRDNVLQIIKYSKKVFIINISEKIVYSTDAIVIAVFLPVSDLTFYAIAGTLLTHLKSFVGAMAIFVNPLSSSLDSKKDEVGVQRTLLASTKAAVLVGTPVCVGFILLGQCFIELWMGPQFGPLSGDILMVLAISHFFGLPQHSITGVLYGLSRHQITALSRSAEAVGNLLLSIVLIQFWGVIGVAIGTLIPQVIIVAVVLSFSACRSLKIPIFDYYMSTYTRPILASIPFCIGCWFINNVIAPKSLLLLFGAIIVALPLYVIPCYYVALSREERKVITGRLVVALRRKGA